MGLHQLLMSISQVLFSNYQKSFPADYQKLVSKRLFLQQFPYTGHLFLFWNKGGDFIKVLWFDRDGFAIFAKLHQASMKVLQITLNQINPQITAVPLL
ncbi:MAG: hypothetical protein C0464_02765 [Cyanobacteria bacterium DS2.008]|nr:hypothetical protein [Cyanobacteria bacterium DS2.008]